jgi:hypothetical protein
MRTWWIAVEIVEREIAFGTQAKARELETTRGGKMKSLLTGSRLLEFKGP